jgi:hypothetical protein
MLLKVKANEYHFFLAEKQTVTVMCGHRQRLKETTVGTNAIVVPFGCRARVGPFNLEGGIQEVTKTLSISQGKFALRNLLSPANLTKWNEYHKARLTLPPGLTITEALDRYDKDIDNLGTHGALWYVTVAFAAFGVLSLVTWICTRFVTCPPLMSKWSRDSERTRRLAEAKEYELAALNANTEPASPSASAPPS